ncbi:DNA Topoisomerase type I [Adoxophyes honmai entomopoxvirus 'L']|uniref:DNA topoisomerase n=1 Tax=Adoxophyes honmai entomopoxvirus 'L' TaxID=1293540 RepID=A0A916KNY7_9POXV|nr:DNA Topoisomerase type I [Adoxophyes honmai entomopoxvirus 'L']CCU55373.1 DNA Topoisomerase type I [Adoxophyes honmai entomopoxvirus 'L']
MRKKYIDTYSIIDEKIYKSNKEINNTELINIIKKYKPPKHLKNIELIAKNVEEADNGIIYIGCDCKNKKQYIYGINYIKRRRNDRIKIFLKVDSKIPKIEKFINKELNIFKKNELASHIYITDKMIFAIILLVEMCFFIRTGKKKYLEDNETIGLITLQKNNFTVEDDVIYINFKGKLSQNQNFSIIKEEHLLIYNMIKLLYNKTDDFIFKNSDGITFTESKLYNMIKQFNIKLKDIRTFGVNRVLIHELWKNVKDLEIMDIRHKDIKKIISKVVNRTANIIGHTPTISKNSYIVDEIRSIIDIDTINKAKEMSFDQYYVYIVNKLKDLILITVISV